MVRAKKSSAPCLPYALLRAACCQLSYGNPTFQGEYEQIAQLVEAAEAAESWDTGKADKHVREAVSLANGLLELPLC